VLLHVAHDADDRERPKIPVHVAELDQLAERILARPARLGERCADHGDMRRVAGVALGEKAPADKWHAHRAEVVRARDCELRVAGASGFPRESEVVLEARDLVGTLKHDKRAVRTSAVERDTVDAADALDARDRAEPRDELLDEAGVSRLGGRVPATLE